MGALGGLGQVVSSSKVTVGMHIGDRIGANKEEWIVYTLLHAYTEIASESCIESWSFKRLRVKDFCEYWNLKTHKPT